MQIKFLDVDMFCIKHQKSHELCQLSDGSLGHLAALFAPDWGWCKGPFATCPPPDDMDLDGWEWTLGLPVPSAEEMAQMDENADALWFDLMEDTL